LTHPRERDLVSRALQAIGSGAEEAVIPFLQSEDEGARCVACQILAEIGTSNSLKALQAASLANPTDFGFNREAIIAVQKIMARS
jgi:HEAT repeat protein